MVGQDAVGTVGRRLAGGGKGGWCRGELRGGCFKRQAGQPVQASGVEMNGFFFFSPFFQKVPRDSQGAGCGQEQTSREKKTQPEHRSRVSTGRRG